MTETEPYADPTPRPDPPGYDRSPEVPEHPEEVGSVSHRPRTTPRRWWVRAAHDLGFLVADLPVAVLALVCCLPLFALGLGTAVLVGGLFVLVAALVVAGGFARFHRLLLGWAGHPVAAPVRPPVGSGLRSLLRRLGDPQSWRELLHVLVVFVVAVPTFAIALTWTAVGLGGTTFVVWGRFLPEPRQGLDWLLGLDFPGAELALNTAIGVVLLVSTPLVLRGLVLVHVGLARALLDDEASALRHRVEQLGSSRAAAGEAELRTLRQLERDLHDGPQQRLLRLGMDLSTAQRWMSEDPERARQLVAEAMAHSSAALAELRGLSRGIAPPVLTERGLEAAITSLVARGSIPASVEVEPVELGEAVRNALYFVTSEALANVEKHSGADRCWVELRAVERGAQLVVADDGSGGATLAKGHGLAGLEERLAGVDGELSVTSPVGGPTWVVATVPGVAPRGGG